MNVRKPPVAVFALCLLSSITVLARSARIAHNPAVEDDIREAVLRYQMLNWVKEGDGVFFIDIDGKDPSDDFMKRFDKFPTRVEKLSRSEMNNKPIGAVVEKVTGRRGIQFRVEKITWRGSNSVEVEGGYYCGGLCASGQTFRVHREQRAWKVTGSTTHWNA